MRGKQIAAGVLAATVLVTSLAAQTMKPKYDQKCIDDAGRAFISCMASAGKSESARQKCTEDRVAAEKKCKL